MVLSSQRVAIKPQLEENRQGLGDYLSKVGIPMASEAPTQASASTSMLRPDFHLADLHAAAILSIAAAKKTHLPGHHIPNFVKSSSHYSPKLRDCFLESQAGTPEVSPCQCLPIPEGLDHPPNHQYLIASSSEESTTRPTSSCCHLE